MKSFLLTTTLLFLGILLLLYIFQDRLIFLPHIGRSDHFDPASFGLNFEEIRIPTSDGETLAAWFFPVEPSRGVGLLFHGNAGHIGHRLPYAEMFRKLGYELLLVDYRGYGASTGTPKTTVLDQDAQAAWEYLSVRRRARPEQAVFIGESLGGAVAARLAAEVQPAALVLSSAFISLPEIARDHYPLLPWRWLARHPLDTRAALAQYRGAVLIAHSPEDEIVPFRHAEALFEAARLPKVFVRLAGGHNEGFLFARREWVLELERFLSHYLPRAEAP